MHITEFLKFFYVSKINARFYESRSKSFLSEIKDKDKSMSVVKSQICQPKARLYFPDFFQYH